VTQWVQAKLVKIVTSLSQLLINYYRYRVKMNVHQTIKTSRPKADKPLSSRKLLTFEMRWYRRRSI